LLIVAMGRKESARRRSADGGPSLPTARRGGAAAGPAAGIPKTIELEDGTVIPVGLPPGVSAEQAQQVIAFLRANPELAKQTANNVKQMYEQNPTAMANMMRYQNSVGREAIAAKMAELKEDPELKPLYDDLAANGPGALKKYYDDPKWCDLVSAKFGDLEALGGDNMVPAVRAPPPPRPVAGPCPPVHQLTTLHDAAKFDCVEALEKVLGEDAVNAALKVDAPDKRAATALHIAAAFGSVNAATFLLDKGASIDLCDPRGNAALHYAAGYGQPELVKLLVARGADVTLQNAQLQTPRDAARANGHGPIVAALSAVMEKAAAAPAPADAPAPSPAAKVLPPEDEEEVAAALAAQAAVA